MKLFFTQDAFYNNLNVPLYDHGKVYEVTDVVPGYIQRWLMRGAVEVVKGSKEDKLPVSMPNPQDGHAHKRATPVGSEGNPIELSPVPTGKPKDEHDEHDKEEKQADKKTK